MFDAPETSAVEFRRGTTNNSPVDRLPKAKEPEAPAVSDLDTVESQALHRRLLGWHQQEIERQLENRFEQAVDEDFYDNIQWKAEDAAIVEERGQQPIVYNVISTSVDWVLGTQKRTRSDFKVLPRRKEEGKPAERKTQLLKYLSDVNKTPYGVSRAFEDAVKVGLGWLETGNQDDLEGEPLYARWENWRHIIYDSSACERDLSDARYINRFRWLDRDVIEMMFPKRLGLIAESVAQHDSISSLSDYGDVASDSKEELLDQPGRGGHQDITHENRQRLRVIECWYRKPAMVKRMKRGAFHGDIYDPSDPNHVAAVKHRDSILVDRQMMRVHVAIFTESGLLWNSVTPYRHNRFPFVPVWGRQRGRDGLPYGMIRGMRGPQEDINKRASKALAILATNKVVMEEDAVPDLKKFLDEVSRPDGVIVKRRGAELDITTDRDLADAHFAVMSQSIALLQAQSGVTDENMGRRTNATSGKAIEARQNQGSMATAGYFDNLRYALQLFGELQLSLIEQFYDEQKSFRITNMRGTPEYITVNDGLPENDIARSKADYVISEQDWNATVRQAQVAELMELLTMVAPGAPQIVLAALDLIVESMDLPSREELVKRIRQLTGMRDPDAEEPTEEEIAAAAKAAEQEAMQKAMVEAEIAEKRASADVKAAQAAKTSADTDSVRAGMVGANAATLKSVLETALLMLQAPQAIPVADAVAHEAGFQSRTELETVAEGAEQVALAEAEMQPPPAPQPAPMMM